MVSEIWESMTSYIRDRAVSPLTGAIIVSWLAWNHRTVIALFSGGSIAMRFGYIDEVIYPTVWSFLLFAIAAPLLSATAYLLWYHKPALWVYKHQLKQRAAMVEARDRADGLRLLTESEAEKLRQKTNRMVEREKEKLRQALEQVNDLESANLALTSSLHTAGKKLEELKASNEPLPAGNAERDEALRTLLLGRAWTLHYDPKAGNSKAISFSATGDIIDGRNDNEWTWRVRDGRLEIFAKADNLYSVFTFSAGAKAFKMVDGEGQVASRSLSGHFIAMS